MFGMAKGLDSASLSCRFSLFATICRNVRDILRELGRYRGRLT